MADVSYVVDIATAMPGGAQTVAQVDALTHSLTTAGVTSDHIHDAIARLSNQFDAAAKASTAAASALSAGQSEYAKLERAALQAAKAEEKAALKGVVPPAIAASAASASAAVNAYAVTLASLEKTASATDAEQKKLGHTLANAKTLHVDAAKAAGITEGQLRKLKGALPALGGALGSVGGIIAGVVDDFGDITEAFGSSTAVAVVAIGAMTLVAVAFVAVSVAVVAATVKIAAWAIGLADANRELALTQEASESLNPALKKLHGTVDDLTSRTGLSAAAIDGIAESLQAAHVAASDMPAALEAASFAEAALGQGGAAKFTARMQASGKSVRAFSATVSAELGGVVSKKLLGLTAQSATFHNNIATLFGGLNIEPVLTGLSKLVALFDANTSSGQAIKFLFEKIFQPLIDNADAAATTLEAFALGFEIGMVRLYIMLKPTIKAIGEFFGQHDSSLTETLDKVAAAGELVAPAVVAMTVGMLVAVGVVSALVGVSLLLFAAFLAIPIAIAAAAVWLEVKFLGAVAAVYNFLSSIDLSKIGTDMILGLVSGISAGAGAVVSAVSGVVTGGIDAAKHLLGIHSPSKVFGEIGDNTVAGFTGSVEGAAPDAQSALESLVDPSGAAGASAGSAGGSRASNAASASHSTSANLQGATFNFYGVRDAEDAESKFGELLTRILEGDAGQLGGASA